MALRPEEIELIFAMRAIENPWSYSQIMGYFNKSVDLTRLRRLYFDKYKPTEKTLDLARTLERPKTASPKTYRKAFNNPDTEERLRKVFMEQKLNDYEIATLFAVGRPTIAAKRISWGFPIVKKKRDCKPKVPRRLRIRRNVTVSYIKTDDNPYVIYNGKSYLERVSEMIKRHESLGLKVDVAYKTLTKGTHGEYKRG